MFEVDDAADEWIYPLEYFDYVHIRNLYGSIDDWPTLYSRVYKWVPPQSEQEYLVDRFRLGQSYETGWVYRTV
jgi:hypothetical protein